MKRTVTMRDLDALSKANGELAAAIPDLQGIIAKSLIVRNGALAGGDVDSALNAVVMGLSVVTDREQILLSKFERAAANFLGESMRTDETLWDFHQRICMLLNTEGDDMVTLRAIQDVQKRNGITLKF